MDYDQDVRRDLEGEIHQKYTGDFEEAGFSGVDENGDLEELEDQDSFSDDESFDDSDYDE